MRFYKIIVGSLFLLFTYSGKTQQIQVLESGKRVSFRGLSVVSDQVFWASGSNGSVVRSTDGGKNLQWISVPGYEKRDFRDIEALSADTAVIMAIAEPAVILKTTDGGKNWRKVFEDTTKGMFLDAMDRSPNGSMIVVGDPIQGHLFTAMSMDNGNSWQIMPVKDGKKDVRKVKDTEAMFASSGTNIKLIPEKDFGTPTLLVTGGSKASIKDVYNYSFNDSLPMIQGGTSTGANSIDYWSKTKSAVIVGGDFSKDTIAIDNCVLVQFKNGKPIFSKPSIPPHGYRSCVIYLNENELVTCGTSGIDVSKDGGQTWQLISKESFHVVQKARNGKAIFLAGGNGRIAQLILP
jgi:photosystem II stability/assembly factor-like uncharacterized protein